MNFEYSNPLNFIFALLGLVAWQLDYFGTFKRAIISLPGKMVVVRRNIFLPIFATLAWILIGISLMGPKEIIGYSNQSLEIKDLFFVVDISRSMLAVDMLPNRLEVAKKEITEFVKKQLQLRIGIIIFSEKAFTLLPLTIDYHLIINSLSEIQVGKFGSGTNIGDSIALAVARLTSDRAKSKVIILLTDGVSNVDSISPIQSAKIAAKKNIKIYTIGIGTENGLLPMGNEGDQRYFQKIPGGSIDFVTLDKISTITGAKSYYAKDESSLENVLDNINELEKTKIEVSNQNFYQELYWKYLFFGVLLLMIVESFRRFWQREAL